MSKPLIEATKDSEIQMVINCNTTLLSKADVLLNISLGVKTLNVIISCSMEQSTYLHGPSCGQKYSVSVF